MIQDIGLASMDVQRFGLEVGSSAVVGSLVGYATKKLAKLLVVFVGLELGLLQLLDMHGLIDIRWQRFEELLDTLRAVTEPDAPPPDIATMISPLSMGGGFAGGFALGFKRG